MKDIMAMIPCAGRGSRMLTLTDDMPKAMLPLHNKPIIGWHLDKLLEEGITNVCIIVGYKKEKLINYVDKFYANKMNICYAEQDEPKGLAHAVLCGIEASESLKQKTKIDFKKLLIILGDTIIKDDLAQLIDDQSWIGYKTVQDYKRWCLLKTSTDDIVDCFVDKPDTEPGTRKAVIGIYYFNNIFQLQSSIKKIIEKNIRIKNEYQLSSAMEDYMENDNTIKAVEFKEWFDCGEVETFNSTRKNISRHFNSVSVTDENTIIKMSENQKKIRQEINWFLNIPNKLRVYIPQLIDYSTIEDKTFYELEYINFNPMHELFLYNLPDIQGWNKFFTNTFNMIQRFNLYSTKARFNTSEHLKDMLLNKTNERINKLIKQSPLGDYSSFWDSLLKKDAIKINGQLFKNYPLIIKPVFDYVEQNIIPDSAKYWQIIHGDLFFGNMLYDINSDTLKIIDPRGNFGIDGVYGDVRYDLAKLAHSIIGKYDFIINGLYAITNENEEFDYILYDSPKHIEIEGLFKQFIEKYGYDYEQILVITGLIFLSLIPLHAENFNNQKMFYLIAMQFFNKVF